MSYFNNRKLAYLIQNVFSQLGNTRVAKEIDSLYVDWKLRQKSNNLHKSSNLEKLYPVRTFFKKHNQSVTENTKKYEKKISDNIVIPKQNVSILANKPKFDKNLLEEIGEYKTKKENISKPLQTSIKTTINQKIKHPGLNVLNGFLDENTNIIEMSKSDDYYSNIFFSSISSKYYIANMQERNSKLKQLKLDIIAKFTKENYYRDYDYSTKLFKKSELEEAFTFNKNITVNMLKVYGDVFGINCVYVYESDIRYLNKFEKARATVIVEETNNKVYSAVKSGTFIRGIDCIDILGINEKYSKSTLSKYKLEKLQNIARMYNLDTKKQGKVGKVNTSKDELIEMLSIS